ncbi:MAG TPA: hypothetical protein VJ836_05945 [Candidatus Saccharimonadales bacterium]|nr:hypothetical protein [Candidatus Saccharimonadales bacterium]
MAPSAGFPVQADSQPQAAAPSSGDTFVLPVLVFGVIEVRRLKRELEALDEFMRQSGIREPGKQPSLPRLSRLLDALAADNRLNLLQAADRQKVRMFLEAVARSAPSIHMSFASDPSSAFTAKMVTWLRANIHPYVLLQIGLQPTIAAGCVVRTTNKVFDFSLRERFARQQAVLMRALEATATPQEASAQAVQAVTASTPREAAQ